MIIIGIDPGITGAVAVLLPSGNGVRVEFHDTPTEQVHKGRKVKTEYLPVQMANILRDYQRGFLGAAPPPIHVYLEKVHSMPKQGVASSFSFGTGYGIWIGILSALQIPYTLVSPEAWKKVLMQGIKDKDAARGRAQQLYPSAAESLKRKKDIGRADALLIAEFGRQAQGGNA